MSHEIKQIENHIEQLKVAQKKGEALQRLMNNADFKFIINEQYLREEPIRLTYAKGHPNMQGELAQRNTMRDLDGIGSLYQFLHNINMVGAEAPHDIIKAEEQIEFIRNQEDEGE